MERHPRVRNPRQPRRKGALRERRVWWRSFSLGEAVVVEETAMAIFPCPDCGREVSHLARRCPDCGRGLGQHEEPSRTSGEDQPFRGGDPTRSKPSATPGPKHERSLIACRKVDWEQVSSWIVILLVFFLLCYVLANLGDMVPAETEPPRFKIPHDSW